MVTCPLNSVRRQTAVRWVVTTPIWCRHRPDPLQQRGEQRRRAPATLCALLIASSVLFTAASAHAGSIAIEWDRSADPEVIGYQVSVGTTPGVYTETFDVGSATSFVYKASDLRVYYLAVASYAAGQRVGALSPPVSAVPFGESADARAFYESLWRNIAAPGSAGLRFNAESEGVSRRAIQTDETADVPVTICWTPSTDCLEVKTVIRRSAEITSLAASADDRLFFIEGHQRIAVIAAGVLQPRPVLVPGSAAVHFEHLHLDPAFATSGLLYVGESETSADGRRQFRVVRYRVAQNQAAERAVIASVALPFSGRPMFSVSSAGHVYVAVPGKTSASPLDQGVILRFGADGTIPTDQSGGSAVIATVAAYPTAMAFDEQEQRLWLVGVDDQSRALVASLDGLVAPSAAPVVSLSAATDTGGSFLFLGSANGLLGKGYVGTGGSIASNGQFRLGGYAVSAVAAASSGDLFVAIAQASATAGSSSAILRLTPNHR